MDVVFVEEFRGHHQGDIAHLPWHEAAPLLELGIVKVVRRKRSKAVLAAPERAIKQ